MRVCEPARRTFTRTATIAPPIPRVVVSVCVCLLGLTTAAVGRASDDNAARHLSAAPDFPAAVARSERRAALLLAEDRLPGLAIAVVEGERVLLARGFGTTVARGKEPVTADTVFRLASLSKGFASALAAQLVREGALRWDARVADYLPTFRLHDGEASRNLTITDILSHRVGLPYHWFDRDLEADQPYPVLAARLDEAPIACTPGRCYAYQNIAFSLIGDIGFAASGEFFYTAVEKRLFHPLEMHNATYGRQALESSPSWARPHVRARRGWTPVRPSENYYRVPPAAGANASARDLAQWMIALLGHRPQVLPAEMLARLHAPQVRTPDQLRGSTWRRERLRNAHYALGWRVYDYAGHRLIYHAGAVQGYRAVLGVLPERDVGVAILWNAETSAPAGLFPNLIDAALGLPGRDWSEPEPGSRRLARR